jgi:hypothetical protein
MKKILFACDGEHFSQGAFDFVRRLNEDEPLLLTGVFLSNAEFSSLWSYANGLSGPLFVPVVEQPDQDALSRSIRHFEQLCQQQGIEYRIHRDHFDFALSELKRETRFADLLVIGSQCYYENLKGVPNPYLQDTIYHAECPVVIVPENFLYPQSVILTYDGTASSVAAIKQFMYLFPEWRTKRSLLVVAGVADENAAIPYQTEIEEWASRHFSDLTIVPLCIDPSKYFTTWIENEKGAMLVCGKQGKGNWFSFFRKNFLEEVLQDQAKHEFFEQELEGNQLPIFIGGRL